MHEFQVSVVVPTAGRRPVELRRALQSVAAQEFQGLVQIIVADDSEKGLRYQDLKSCVPEGRLEIIRTFGSLDANRGIAVCQSRGQWIAFLDDDDFWHPLKLSKQLQAAELLSQQGFDPVISSRFSHLFQDSNRRIANLPNRLVEPTDNIEDYLFESRGPSVGRASYFTSTLFTSRSFAIANPWRRLDRHQDWDWLVRLGQSQNVRFHQCPEDLVTISVGSNASISATSNWRSSLDWALQTLLPVAKARTSADFLVAQPLRYALQARDARGVGLVVKHVFRLRCIPSISSVLLGLTGLASRSTFQKAMAFFGLKGR